MPVRLYHCFQLKSEVVHITKFKVGRNTPMIRVIDNACTILSIVCQKSRFHGPR